MKKSSIGYRKLLTFIVFAVAALMMAPVQAGRFSKILNSGQNMQVQQEERDKAAQRHPVLGNLMDEPPQKSPVVRQDIDFDYNEYVKLEEPFTQTDKYQYMNAFLIGAKLSDTYANTDECVDAWVGTVDDGYYFKNNRTKVNQENSGENAFHLFLNITGLLGGDLADIFPQCWLWGEDIIRVETARWLEFNSNWGNFFLAFLFNQMGNALNFQAKFTSISENKAKQNYIGVWQEYGDLFYLIWQFPPLPDSSLEGIEAYFAALLEDVPVYEDPAQNYIAKKGLKVGMKSFARSVLNNADAVQQKVETKISEAKETAVKVFDGAAKTLQASRTTARERAASINPTVGLPFPAFNGWPDTQNLFYGFANGVVDVFPYESLPSRCRGNITQIFQAINNLFFAEPLPYTWPENDIDYMYEIQSILQFPYGVTFSCAFAVLQIFIWDDPNPEGELTEEEKLRVSIIIVHDVLTNILFNLGYMFNDVLSFVTLEQTAQDFWTKIGYYCGDFAIRFFWRNDFTTTFVY